MPTLIECNPNRLCPSRDKSVIKDVVIEINLNWSTSPSDTRALSLSLSLSLPRWILDARVAQGIDHENAASVGFCYTLLLAQIYIVKLFPDNHIANISNLTSYTIVPIMLYNLGCNMYFGPVCSASKCLPATLGLTLNSLGS